MTQQPQNYPRQARPLHQSNPYSPLTYGNPSAQWPNQMWHSQGQHSAQTSTWQAMAPNNYGYNQPMQPFSVRTSKPRRKGGIAGLIKFLGFLIILFFAGMALGNLFGSGDSNGNDRLVEHYENEDYQVPSAEANPPSLPVPQTYEEAANLMSANAIYDIDVASPVRCDAQPIDLTKASKSQLEQHFNDYMGCLMRVYGPALEQAGYSAVRPNVTIYDYPIETRCGQLDMSNASYCAADQQVYYAIDLPSLIPSQLRNTPFVVESVIAHEFSHAIQARTGILISEAAFEQAAETESEANELSRRTEVQADCWAGMFNQSVSQSLNISANNQEYLSQLFYSIGDDVLTGDPTYDGNHGLGATRQSWYLEGAANTKMGACNSFIASPDEVR